jgi:hypothetical protein
MKKPIRIINTTNFSASSSGLQQLNYVFFPECNARNVGRWEREAKK